MKKIFYILSICVAAILMAYFYLINFDNMSETMLVISVLYWYIPLTLGLYGLTAQRIDKTISDSNTSTFQHIFSWSDSVLNLLVIIVFIASGIIGVLLFFIPLTIFKAKTDNYDLKVAISGSLIWLFLLVLFFVGIWPML